MIVTTTPLRVTLGGGGTDLPSYYREHGGFIFAMGIDRYTHVMVNRPILDDRVRLSHGKTEAVSRVSELDHDLAREALRMMGVERGIEVSSMSDVPDGTGLGSSGAYLVGLLLALHRLRGEEVSPAALAEEACTIEMDVLGRPVGKQDQYMAAFGGLTVLDIGRDGSVAARRVDPPADALDELVANTHLYYTGVRRSAASILEEQSTALEKSEDGSSVVGDAMHRIRELGHRILAAVEAGDPDRWGELLHEHWESKKRLSGRVSLRPVDELYERVRREFGVLGGKIAGAGGGGFLMLYCPSEHARLEAFMLSRGLPRLEYTVSREGARVVAAASSEGSGRGSRGGGLV